MRISGGLVLALLVAWGGVAAAGPTDQEFPLDVDLGDRVDPVRPGGEVVYELEVENFTAAAAPGVVVTDHLPPGTTFVAAHRQPDWAEVPATVDVDRVRFELGDVAPCDQTDTPRCRDLWVVLRLSEDLPEGTLLTNRVTIESSDPALPPNEATTVTLASSAALRSAKLNVGRPGRDRVKARAALARDGVHTPLDPPTPTVDVTQGVTVRLGVPGEPPVVDLTLPPGEMECTAVENPLRRVRCRPRDRRRWKAQGLKRLDVTLPGYLSAQRNNALFRLKLVGLDLSPDTGPEFELTLEAAGEIFHHAVVLQPSKSGRALAFAKGQGEP